MDAGHRIACKHKSLTSDTKREGKPDVTVTMTIAEYGSNKLHIAILVCLGHKLPAMLHFVSTVCKTLERMIVALPESHK